MITDTHVPCLAPPCLAHQFKNFVNYNVSYCSKTVTQKQTLVLCGQPLPLKKEQCLE